MPAMMNPSLLICILSMLSLSALAQSEENPAAATAAAAVAADPAGTLPVESVPATDLAQPADPLPVSDTAPAGESAAVVPPFEPVPAAVDPVSPVTIAADPTVPPVELLPAVVDPVPDAASTPSAESMVAPSQAVGETAAGPGVESATQIVARVRKQVFDRTWCAVLSVVSPQSMGSCQEPSKISVGEGQGEADKVGLKAEGAGDGKGGVSSGKKGVADAFLASLSMILVTEIGDETFIIAALMAMRHSRGVVLAGALSALAIMTVLSTGLGVIVPNLISQKATQNAATVLYTFFGMRLLYIAWRADPHDTPAKEMEEVEEKLEREDNKGKEKQRGNFRKFLGSFLTPVFLEAFILTFLAEWGDRSQIATIALATHKNPIGVTIGATLGHVICTSIAVVGGRMLAAKISQRTVATIGGLLFLAFAMHSFFTPPI